MFQSLQVKLYNWLIRKLIRPITENDIIKILPNGDVLYRGRVLDKETKDKLSQDAENYNNSTIWRLLQDEALFEAYKKGSAEARSFDDTIMSKAMIYLIDVLRSKINKISQLK